MRIKSFRKAGNEPWRDFNEEPLAKKSDILIGQRNKTITTKIEYCI